MSANKPGRNAASVFLTSSNALPALLELFGRRYNDYEYCVRNFIGNQGQSSISMSSEQAQEAARLLAAAGFFTARTLPEGVQLDRAVVMGGSYGTMYDGLIALGARSADCLFGQRLRSDTKDGDIASDMRLLHKHAPWMEASPWFQDQVRRPQSEDGPFPTEHDLGILAALEIGHGDFTITPGTASGTPATFLFHGQMQTDLILWNIPNAPGKSHATTTSSITYWADRAGLKPGQHVAIAVGAIEGIRHFVVAKDLLLRQEPSLNVHMLMRETPQDEHVNYVRSGLHEIGKLVQLAFNIPR